MDQEAKAGDLSGMSTLAARVQQLIDTRLEGENRTSFELRVGLPKGLLGKLARGEKTKPSGQTLQRVAEVFGVSPTWLLGGEEVASEPAPERVYEPTDRYPSRAQAIKLLEGIMPQAVLEAMMFEVYKSAEDPGLEHWMGVARQLAKARADMAKHVEVMPEETAPKKLR